MLVILSGVSGAGKNTVCNLLMKKDKNIITIPSYTTRAKREYEEDGREYIFVTESEFKELIANDELYEYSYHYGDYYGLPKKILDSKLEDNIVVKDIDVDGTKRLKEIFASKSDSSHKYKIISIFLEVDKNLMKERLKKRGDKISEEKAHLRLDRYDYEIDKKKYYDKVFDNTDSEDVADKIYEIIKKELN